jgi:hypothetical protein
VPPPALATTMSSLFAAVLIVANGGHIRAQFGC